MKVMNSASSRALAIALLPVTFAGYASAQTIPAAATPAPAAAEAPTSAIGDIVVTAERRAVNIQRAPISITAFSAKDLTRSNITTPSAIQQIAPDVKFIEIGEQPSLLIRGAGQQVANVYNDPSASFNLDGVAIARPLAINGVFFDLERVEVLKGPQGTLYGRNATVGAINVLSRKPTHEFEAEIGGQLENYGGIQTHGIINIPIGDTLAVRAGFSTIRHDGYLSNGTNDADSVGGRIKLLWQATDKLDITLTATVYEDRGKGTGDVPLKSPTGSFLFPQNPYFVGVGPTLNAADRSTKVPDDAHQRLHSNFFSGEINWDFGAAKLTLIPAHIRTSYETLTYNGGFRQAISSTDNQDSVEARLSSTGTGRLKWLVGSIYLYDNQFSDNDLKTRPTTRQLQNTDSASLASYAFFTQATYSLFDKLRVTGGVRYSNDHKKISGVFINVLDQPISPVTSQFPSKGDATFKNTSFRAGIDYDLATDSLLYANFATGYKAGGFQPGVAPNVYQPEKLTSYTVGVKNRFFDSKVTLNLEAWYWNYRNYQFVQFGFVNPAPNFALTTINAPKVQDYGAELTSAYQFTPNDRLTIDVAYTIAKYTDFSAPAFAPTGVPATVYTGDHLNDAPVWSGVLGYVHTFKLSSDARIDVGSKSQFQSSHRIAPQHILGAVVGGDHVTDADITYVAPRERWRAGAFVDNIENEPVIYFAGNTPAGLWGHPRPPRIFGVRASARF